MSEEMGGTDSGILEAALQESSAKPRERKKDQEPKQTRLRYPDLSPLKKKTKNKTPASLLPMMHFDSIFGQNFPA